MQHRLFITGTDTDVGKTHCGAVLAKRYLDRGERVGVYKPVASGCRRVDGDLVADDAAELWMAAGRPQQLADVCPQRFAAPLAPYLAAAAENASLDSAQLVRGIDAWQTSPVVLVEGAGGLFSPLTESLLNIDLIGPLQIDEVVLVAANRIGVAHQIISTVIAANARGVDIDRILLNQVDGVADDSVATNWQLLKDHIDQPIEEIAHRSASGSTGGRD